MRYVLLAVASMRAAPTGPGSAVNATAIVRTVHEIRVRMANSIPTGARMVESFLRKGFDVKRPDCLNQIRGRVAVADSYAACIPH